MKKVLIIDTSVLCVWLKVGGKETCGSGVTLLTYEKVNDKIMQEIAEGTQLVLPLAVVIETGNHIAQMSGDKFAVANSFADIIEKTIDSETPWVAFNTQQTLWTEENLRALIDRWKDTALSGQSLGDASIVDVASYYSKMGFPVEIFTGDQGLKAYEPQVRLSIPRRRQ